jgi:hypothetical protein
VQERFGSIPENLIPRLLDAVCSLFASHKVQGSAQIDQIVDSAVSWTDLLCEPHPWN